MLTSLMLECEKKNVLEPCLTLYRLAPIPSRRVAGPLYLQLRAQSPF
jgi:hypothetical protein